MPTDSQIAEELNVDEEKEEIKPAEESAEKSKEQKNEEEKGEGEKETEVEDFIQSPAHSHPDRLLKELPSINIL